MRDQIDEFLNTLRAEKGYSNNTIVAYRNDLGQFSQFVKNEIGVDSWDRVTNKDLMNYVDRLKNEHEYASATVARKVAATKSFFRHLVSRGIIKEDPSANLDSPKVRKYLPSSISEAEVERLLRAPAKHNSARGFRDSALLELLYATGMRVSELVALNVDDVNLEEGYVRCLNKTGKLRERVIPIYRRAVEALRCYLRESRPKLVRDDAEPALFLNHRGNRLTRQGLWLIIKRYVEEVGIEASVTPHTLRHSFATHLLNGGAKVREVQGLLGHANISTTQVYAQLNQDRLREIYDEAHPRAR
ncbi:MAG TPA: site-specific tyrosine recombinase XerD [Chloroflexi bacterium]|jgi:integrase/recombinase XerD|nr:site-specific tyrosine recombinase XerD [Chloroflexota bacterium]